MEQPLLIEFDRAARIAIITLNRPSRRNALNLPLLQALATALREAIDDPSCRALILSGAGPVFCAGLDLAETAESPREAAEAVRDVLLAIARCPLPTIAVVRGAAVAGGAGLAAGCDFVVMEETARIGFSEVRRGLVPALVSVFLRGQIRDRDLRELLLTGELISARRALEIGLVNRLAPDGGALAAAGELAASLMAGGPEAVATTKRLLASRSWEADCEHALAVHHDARDSAEARQGAAAFFSKSPPPWT